MINNKSPLELLLVILDKGYIEDAQQVLDMAGVEYNMLIKSTGTADSEVLGLFNFGLIDRDILGCFIESSNSEDVLAMLRDELQLGLRHRGIAMTLSINGASSNILDILGISYIRR